MVAIGLLYCIGLLLSVEYTWPRTLLHNRFDNGGLPDRYHDRRLADRNNRIACAHQLEAIAELLGHMPRVHAVANELRLDEHDDFGALFFPRRVAEHVSDHRNLVQDRYPRFCFLRRITDKA